MGGFIYQSIVNEVSMKKTIVISAVNLRKGGTLTILRSCLSYLSTLAAGGDYRIVALVHLRNLADFPHIEYIEIPWAIEGWGKRLWCEYVTMNSISKELGDIDLWLSLHDTTPRVKARRQAVYCQTSFPFYKWKWRDLRFDYKVPLFAMFTRYAYRINIHRNHYLIVQQEWLRKGFSQMFSLPYERFIVAPPERKTISEQPTVQRSSVYTFFYASTADCHKNFETLCRAAEMLEAEVGNGQFQVILTLSGTENKYAHWLYKKWGSVVSIKFAGFMNKQTLFDTYAQTDCFVFPSQIETWGLPISEFMAYEKPMLLSDLPYTYETAAGSKHTAFFPSGDAYALKQEMKKLLTGDESSLRSVKKTPIAEPTVDSWADLFSKLLAE